MTRAIPQLQPQPPPPPQKSHLEKLRKYGAMDFLGKKEDDPMAIENWLDIMERVLRQLHCTPEQNLEGTVSHLTPL